MNTKVTITAGKDGSVFTSTGVSQKDGKEYGYIRLEQKKIDLTAAVVGVKSISCLKSISRENFNRSGLKAGQEFPGQILIVESLEKNEKRMKQEPKKIGELVLTHAGSPIYRDTVYTTDMSKTDVLVQHEQTKEEIKAASDAAKEVVLSAAEANEAQA